MDQYVIIYFHDTLIFSKSPEQHYHHVQSTLESLQKHYLYVKLEKCTFDQATIDILGYIIFPGCIEIDPQKVEAIHNLTAPQILQEFQCFLGFVHFYRRFITNFYEQIAPVTHLLQKAV